MDQVCPYCENEGWYDDWTYTYHTTHAACIASSTVDVAGESVVMTKHEFMVMSGGFGILLGIVVMWAWLKAVL